MERFILVFQFGCHSTDFLGFNLVLFGSLTESIVGFGKFGLDLAIFGIGNIKVCLQLLDELASLVDFTFLLAYLPIDSVRFKSPVLFSQVKLLQLEISLGKQDILVILHFLNTGEIVFQFLFGICKRKLVSLLFTDFSTLCSNRVKAFLLLLLDSLLTLFLGIVIVIYLLLQDFDCTADLLNGEPCFFLFFGCRNLVFLHRFDCNVNHVCIAELVDDCFLVAVTRTEE